MRQRQFAESVSGLVIGRQGGHECYLNHMEKGGSLQEAIPWNTKAEWMCVWGGLYVCAGSTGLR